MSLYSTGVSMPLVASHHLERASPQEREEHEHSYVVEIEVRGSSLDSSGYLVDIAALQASLGLVLDHYRGRSLNQADEFSGVLPTLENFARVVWERMAETVDPRAVCYLEVRVWESDDAWAGYSGELDR